MSSFRTQQRTVARSDYQAKTMSTSTTGKVPPSTPTGTKSALATRITTHLRRMRPKPVSTGTGAGQEIVAQPPTVVPPPNATSAVEQQLSTSSQLAENTTTGTGIGAGRTSAPVTKRVMNSTAYVILAALGAALLLAFAFDRGKL